MASPLANQTMFSCMTTPMKRTQTFLVVAQPSEAPTVLAFSSGKVTGKFTAFPHMEELKGTKWKQ